ncbi:pleckstrin homology domain-containing family H member 2-like [Oppia nitens]|uniref:pleckstrin homology domain-containing family H member 2-like n=1 Tax=Oppia nitens TaxID=1686743 RepID=UPI0023DB1F20|nr:pleckstrin homology domain-containing family H member 2-like [Oppia nitens]
MEMIGESIEEPTLLGSIGNNGSIDWQKRCIDLEISLQQLASHSNKVRHVFVNKIADLECRLKEALKKAEDSEHKYCSIIESLLNESNRKHKKKTEMEESTPELSQLKHAMEEKEKVISDLEVKIEEQKKLRLRDAKQVEEKATKIKEWVSLKLKELEEQNNCLRKQNRKCNEELQFFKQHLHTASPETRRKLEFVLKQYSDQSSISYANNRLYAYHNATTFSTKEEFKDRLSKRELYSTERDTNYSNNSSDDEGFSHSGSQRFSRSSRPQKPIPQPRTRIPVGKNDLSSLDLNPLICYASRSSNSLTYFSRAGSLDRKLADMKRLNFNELKKKKNVFAANEVHDYSDIYTPSKEAKAFLLKDFESSNQRPPTPPLHRCPSWESRIYQIASTGIPSANSNNSTPNHSIRLASRNPNKYQQNYSPKTILNEYNVPVFATVKGRASRIRSIPFTDDSSDSSDNETDVRITTTTITTGTTSSSGHESDLFVTPAHTLNRDITVNSNLSEDYALPPDAVLSASMDVITLNDAPPEVRAPKRFSSLQRPTSIIRDEKQTLNDIFEKSGYLTKLGGRLKTWRRRWFVLKDNVLSYYRSQSDANKGKPRGQIHLEKSCRITTTRDSGTFQIHTGNKKKIYYLTSDSMITLEEWIRILNSVLKRNAVFHINDDQKPTIEGFVTKVKSGHSKRCWCALYGRYLFYFKSPNDKIPVNKVDLKSAKVEEVENVSDSDNEDTEDPLIQNRQINYTISIFPKHSAEPIYLLLSSKQDLNEWLYHLTVAVSGEHCAGTPFEHLVSRLMKAEGECAETLDNHSLWKNPLLLYSKENISEPLTTLPTDYLKTEAIKLFKSIQLYTSVPLNSSGIDYHVSLVQNSLQLCLTHSELQSELFFQLIKQSSNHFCNKLCGSSGVHQFLLCATQTIFTCDTSGTCSEKTSPTSINESAGPLCGNIPDKNNPLNVIFIQTFQLLSIAISLFTPQSRALWFLKQHLRRTSDTATDVGKYAIYCRRALDRTLKNGPREFGPSRMEVLSILLRNPYHHSLPHSIPVNFVNRSYHVVGFDGSTTITEFCDLLNSEFGIRENSLSGYALYSDDPLDKDVEHLLDCKSKLGDIISQWERILRENHLGRFENTKVVKLLYKQRLCLKSSVKSETEKERLLSVYQINNRIVFGRFPVTQELALELCALLAQIEFGDFVSVSRPQIILQQVIDWFFPIHFKEVNFMKTLMESIRDKWMELKSRSTVDCIRIYLNCSRKWPFWGSTLFEAELAKPVKLVDSYNPLPAVMQSHTKLWIAVSDDSMALLDFESFHLITRYSYKNLMTFGGCRQDFMLVFTLKGASLETDSGSGTGSGHSSRADSHRSERLLFMMNKQKIVEITHLIADYINSDSCLNAVSTVETPHETLDSSSAADKCWTGSTLFSRMPSLKMSSAVSHTKL